MWRERKKDRVRGERCAAIYKNLVKLAEEFRSHPLGSATNQLRHRFSKPPNLPGKTWIRCAARVLVWQTPSQPGNDRPIFSSLSSSFVLFFFVRMQIFFDYKSENAKDWTDGNVQSVPADMIRLGDARRQKECCLWFQPANHMNGKPGKRPESKALPRIKKPAKSLFLFVLQLTTGINMSLGTGCRQSCLS
ncbi:hypothetical protein M441DRAFT_340567 [Trichoderma asperellum CBS 433.97]|uniref:Uncharacterized protein n=1 Tax=Trichoderma asperellum (strain ATCC 204424 / CBS 433.97 / NBRC 101777) TaxID=1042311 RepID=A0A2T3ZGW7_TRIA4|nr:hypothetical protein M441DRAFT_340567 [Trichoderma asperellum CBS 433.97]PTB44055.1 hypothetical protein M441DRAFT_340567 [Trichoderma asperellum CBS 433.97]